MPIVVNGKLLSLSEPVTKMSMRDLIAYEAALWKFVNTPEPPFRIVTMLNNIYQEVEWRAANTYKNR